MIFLAAAFDGEDDFILPEARELAKGEKGIAVIKLSWAKD